METTTPRKIALVVTKLRLGDKQSDADYWRSLPYQARIDALEEIREEYHRWKADAQPGIQKIYRVIKR